MEDIAEYIATIDIEKIRRTDTTRILCWKCKGVGVIELFKNWSHTQGKIVENHVCPLCDGKRVLDETVVKTYRRVE